MTTPREAVAELVAGEQYTGAFQAFTGPDGRPDPGAMADLLDGLRTAEGGAREEVALALVAVAQRTDPLWREGGILVRDPAIVEALVTSGGLQRDGAKSVCFLALAYAVPRQLLAPHTQALLDELKRCPDALTLLIVARLHDPRAAPVVADVLERVPTWKVGREGQAAAAAYGDLLTEHSVIERFLATTDPKEASDLALHLGLMGTPACLRTLGEALRTPLVQADRYIRRSCRVDVIAGLRMTYTDAVPLFENRFTSDAAFDAAEAFVTATLGVRWTTARPPFAWKEVIPH